MNDYEAILALREEEPAEVGVLDPDIGEGVKHHEQASAPRPQLADVFGHFRTTPAFAAVQFVIPAGSVNIVSGESAWYTLARLECGVHLPECFIIGSKVAMLPTDPAGNGYGSGLGIDGATTAIAWGNGFGTSAAIVMGENLGLADAGSWTSRKCNLAGIETGVSAISGGESYIDHVTFPSGKMNDVTPGKLWRDLRWLPATHRLTEGNRLELAVVFRSSDVHGKTATNALCGHAEIQVIYQPTRSARDFSSL